jgi:TetR/AcrR family transcriptional regulator, regulator of mycofactocin system
MSGVRCGGSGENGTVIEAVPGDTSREGTRARIERAALDLFTRRGFEGVTIDEIADVAGISRRTYFRYFATKADAVWGDFSGHVERLAALLRDSGSAQTVLASICDAYVEVNDYAPRDLPLLRQRMQLILTEPALLAHSQLRYADVDRVVAGYVALRTGTEPGELLPRLVATSTRAAATTAFEAWLTYPPFSLDKALRTAFDELTTGFRSLDVQLPSA